MRKKIGIELSILLNVGFIYLLIMGVILYYGFISVPLGKESIIEITELTSYDTNLIIRIIFLSIIACLINYFLFKKMIRSKKSFLISCIIILIGIAISTPFGLSARKSFIRYKSGEMQLQDYIGKEKINEVQLITNLDTIQVEEIDCFIRDISMVKYKKGLWKYPKRIKIMIRYTDGGIDSIYTNQNGFFHYKEMDFITDKNIMEKYLILENK